MVLKFLILGMEILPLEISTNSFCAFLFLSWFRFIVAVYAGAKLKGQEVITILSQRLRLLKVCKFVIQCFPY